TKFALFTLDGDRVPAFSAGGKIERIGLSPRLAIRGADGELLHQTEWKDEAQLSHGDLLTWLFDWAGSHLNGRDVVAVGHRIVHGGTEFARPCLIDEAVLEELDKLCPLAPLHQPHN
ncbi:MAG: acetate kinase, partial [Bosea sp. (in: a-proteobacteria)]|nr:acetate kinase [Bosea sp. (in: a-proteobacteria)]